MLSGTAPKIMFGQMSLEDKIQHIVDNMVSLDKAAFGEDADKKKLFKDKLSKILQENQEKVFLSKEEQLVKNVEFQMKTTTAGYEQWVAECEKVYNL